MSVSWLGEVFNGECDCALPYHEPTILTLGVCRLTIQRKIKCSFSQTFKPNIYPQKTVLVAICEIVIINKYRSPPPKV